MSLMLKYQRKQRAAEKTVKAEGADVARIGTVSAGKIGEQQLMALITAALSEDLKSLGDIQSIERRADVKREQLIPKYRDYVARLRASGKVHNLLGYYLVWLFDAGDIESGLDLGAYMDEKGAGLPERFSRDLHTFIADAVLDWSEDEYDAGRTPQPYFGTVFDHVESADWDMPDEVRAQYFRLAGFLLERNGENDGAITALERALELGAKVKTKLKELKRQQTDTE